MNTNRRMVHLMEKKKKSGAERGAGRLPLPKSGTRSGKAAVLGA